MTAKPQQTAENPDPAAEILESARHPQPQVEQPPFLTADGLEVAFRIVSFDKAIERSRELLEETRALWTMTTP